MPDNPMFAAGRSAAIGRPPGITRSGQNDDFGRGVVRALRQTGRVTVRLLLRKLKLIVPQDKASL